MYVADDVRFNSRAHGGRDEPGGVEADGVRVSIHAPTGGATASAAIAAVVKGFNSRAHGGRDMV
mgnify:CR=1 FL=1